MRLKPDTSVVSYVYDKHFGLGLFAPLEDIDIYEQVENEMQNKQ